MFLADAYFQLEKYILVNINHNTVGNYKNIIGYQAKMPRVTLQRNPVFSSSIVSNAVIRNTSDMEEDIKSKIRIIVKIVIHSIY